MKNGGPALLENLTEKLNQRRGAKQGPYFKVLPSGCWEWLRAKTKAGYGVVSIEDKLVYSHVLLFEASGKNIPIGLELDHLCRNRACCNPAHLEAVTPKENVLRGNGPTALKAKQTHCKNGHELTIENTYTIARSKGKRECVLCHINRQSKRNAMLAEDEAFEAKNKEAH